MVSRAWKGFLRRGEPGSDGPELEPFQSSCIVRAARVSKRSTNAEWAAKAWWTARSRSRLGLGLGSDGFTNNALYSNSENALRSRRAGGLRTATLFYEFVNEQLVVLEHGVQAVDHRFPAPLARFDCLLSEPLLKAF